MRASVTAALMSPRETGIRRTSACIASTECRVEHRLERAARGAGGLLDDRLFLRSAGIPDPKLEHEPVELRLGKGIGPLLLDGVLGGQHEEGVGEVVGGAARRDLVLLHRLEQRRLGLGRGPVDLVGEHHVGEDRSLDEAEGAPARGQVFLDDLGAGDVARHEVGGELHPIEGEVERLGDGRDHERLGESGNPDQEGMSTGQDSGQDAFDDVFLPHDPPGHLGAEPGNGVEQPRSC